MADVSDVCVLGLGLIGGSVLRAAGSAGYTVWGATASANDVDAATSAGFDVTPTVPDALRRAAERDALVVLAAPLPAVDELLVEVAELAPDCLVTDVVSVKQPVADAVAKRLLNGRYVGGHPMAGRSASGWAAGSADLFHDAAWVLTTDSDATIQDWAEVAELALACGAHVVPATARDHDDAVGRVSHLAHVLAAVLASTGAAGGPLALALAAGSFTDGTRVAGSRPELVRAMCEGNRSGLLPALDDALGQLGAARGSLASTGSLGATINAGHRGRAALTAMVEGSRTAGTIRLDRPGALTELAELGRSGGRITALDRTDGILAHTETP